MTKPQWANEFGNVFERSNHIYLGILRHLLPKVEDRYLIVTAHVMAVSRVAELRNKTLIKGEVPDLGVLDTWLNFYQSHLNRDGVRIDDGMALYVISESYLGVNESNLN